MGRHSEEAKRLAGSVAGLKPAAPKGLNTAEAVLWDKIVEGKPEEWFTRDNLELLKLYCRNAVHLDWLQERKIICMRQVESFEDDLEQIDSLGGALRNLEKFEGLIFKGSQTLMNVATKLRLTPQAQINPSATKSLKTKPENAPWKTDSEEDLYAEIDEPAVGSA